jgi:hypothetical protein
MERHSERIQQFPINLFERKYSASRAGVWREGGKGGGQRFQDAGAQAHVVELAFAANGDDAGGLEFLDVVRERCRRNGQRCSSLAAA